MPGKIINIESLRENIIQQLNGKPAWGFRRGYSSFLTVEFGPPESSSAGGTIADHGAWHLWIELASWRLSRGSEVLFGSDDEEASIQDAMQLIERSGSLQVVSANVDEFLSDLILKFGDGLTLTTFTSSSMADDRLWSLYFPSKRVVVAYADGRIVEMGQDG